MKNGSLSGGERTDGDVLIDESPEENPEHRETLLRTLCWRQMLLSSRVCERLS